MAQRTATPQRSRMAGVAALLALLATAALAAPAKGPRVDSIPERLWSSAPPQDPGVHSDTVVTMGAFSRLAKVVSPAVVNLTVTRLRRDAVLLPESTGGQLVSAQGTGFFVHEDGWLLTNFHVVEGAAKITVRTADDRTFEARIAGLDAYTDLALLKVDRGGPFPVAALGDSDAVEIGEWVVAVGNPYGLGHTVTAGIVSAKGRSNVQPGQPRHASYIQTDASINPGNSGGPLVNIGGQVVAINAAVVSKAQGIGFAIPVNIAKKLLPQLARGRVERSWLGISVAELTAPAARSLRLDRTTGALVRDVIAGGPGAAAGLRTGDVILRFGDVDIKNAHDLPWLAASEGIGKRVKLEVVREGQPLRLEVTLTAQPQRSGEGELDALAGPDANGEAEIRGFGMRAATATEALRKRFRQVRSAQGAVVVQVDGGGPAWLAGVRVGDVILQVERRAVTSVHDLLRLAELVQDSELLPVHVARGGQPMVLTLRRGR